SPPSTAEDSQSDRGCCTATTGRWPRRRRCVSASGSRSCTGAPVMWPRRSTPGRRSSGCAPTTGRRSPPPPASCNRVTWCSPGPPAGGPTPQSHANATLFFDLRARAWAPELLAAFDLDPALFPEALPPWEVVGGLEPAVARPGGVAAGGPVGGGAGGPPRG